VPAEHDNDGNENLPPHVDEVRSLLVKTAKAYKDFLAAMGSRPGPKDCELLEDAEALGRMDHGVVAGQGRA